MREINPPDYLDIIQSLILIFINVRLTVLGNVLYGLPSLGFTRSLILLSPFADVDECLLPPSDQRRHHCQQHCEKLSTREYACSCDAGYKLHSDMKSCIGLWAIGVWSCELVYGQSGSEVLHWFVGNRGQKSCIGLWAIGAGVLYWFVGNRGLKSCIGLWAIGG